MIRINLTKKEIINSIYMQIGFSKKISETLLEDILDIRLWPQWLTLLAQKWLIFMIRSIRVRKWWVDYW